MSHGFETQSAHLSPLPEQKWLRVLVMGMTFLNRQIVRFCMVAMFVATLILTYSVISRYLFKAPTDWQDEACVFMLIGVSFFSAASVQSYRGHIGIEVLSSLLPTKVNAIRLILVDVISFAFCSFFSWKSWTLFYEAWTEGQTTSSTFAPPLWIPYAMMAFGMSLLSLQIVLQILTAVLAKEPTKELA